MKVLHLETTVLGTKRLNCLGTSRLNCLGTKRFSWVRNDRRCETTGNLTINLMYQKLILLYNWNFFLTAVTIIGYFGVTLHPTIKLLSV